MCRRWTVSSHLVQRTEEDSRANWTQSSACAMRSGAGTACEPTSRKPALPEGVLEEDQYRADRVRSNFVPHQCLAVHEHGSTPIELRVPFSFHMKHRLNPTLVENPGQ